MREVFKRPFKAVLEIPGGIGRRIPSLEGMRGYAVLLVFLVHHHTLFGHFLPRQSPLYELSQFAHDIGHSGVDLFFVLSGFLIYSHLLQKSPRYSAYLYRRVRRIYPAFLCIFGIYLLLSHLIPSVSKLPHPASREAFYVLENLLLLPGIFAVHPLITVAWSLSYEFFFYLSLPLLLNVTGMRRWTKAARVLFFAGLFIIHCIAYRAGLLLHIRLSMFVAGILLSEAFHAGRTKKKLSTEGEMLAIGVYLTVLPALTVFRFSQDGIFFHPHFSNLDSVYWTALLSVSLFGVALYCFAFDGVLKRIFSSLPLRWVGNMSYTYFLFHGLILNAVAFLLARLLPVDFQSTPFFLALVLLNLLLTLGASAVFFLLVEKPFSIVVKQPVISHSLKDENIPSQGGKKMPVLSLDASDL